MSSLLRIIIAAIRLVFQYRVTNVPLSLIECPECHDLLKELDKHYDIPGRKRLGKNIDAVYNNSKRSIIAIFSKVKRVSIS